MGKLINRIPGSFLLISSLPGSALRTHVESLGKPHDFKSVLRALPGKLDIKRHSPSILYLWYTGRQCRTSIMRFVIIVIHPLSFTTTTINRGSYMSAQVLLNVLNKLWKIDKMRGLRSILSLFLNEFNKFNNTGARTFDSIYHMILRNFEISILT